MSRATSKPPPLRLIRPGVSALDTIPVEAQKALHSLGFEIASLLRGARVLLARARRGSLPADVIGFVSQMSMTDIQPELPVPFTIRVAVETRETRWIESGERPILPPVLLALFHLPALRGFWIRELRQSHFRRLLRALPKAWFVTDDPPIGAVVANLGITSWKTATDQRMFRRSQIAGVELAIESREPLAEPMDLTYARSA